MIKVRYDVFETNSSSTHSLIILNDHKYRYALKAANPQLAEEFEKAFGEENRYTKEDLYKALENIGAKVDIEHHTLDLTEVDPKHFDFGYTGPTAYVDPAHKLLFVLTMLDNDGWSYDPDDYFKKRFQELLSSYDITYVLPPKDGWTGIDHQSREEIEYDVKYDIENFIFRKDYVLLLDHD